jgi:hypothetical protein
LIFKFVARRLWEAKLRRWQCQPLEGKGPLNTAEWWRGPNGLFTVPVETDGSCEFWALQKLCETFGVKIDHPDDLNEH